MRIHVLDGDVNGVFRIVVHAPVPAANNSAGILWSDALKNSGRAVSQLPVGNGPGQISQSELNQITSGSLVEATGYVAVYGGETPAQLQARLDAEAVRAVNEVLSVLQKQLAYFGYTVT